MPKVTRVTRHFTNQHITKLQQELPKLCAIQVIRLQSIKKAKMLETKEIYNKILYLKDARIKYYTNLRRS